MTYNKNFGKIENGEISFAPKTLTIGNVKYYNPKTERYLNEGWFPVIETDQPEGNDNTYYVLDGWSFDDGKILRKWKQVEVEQVEENEHNI